MLISGLDFDSLAEGTTVLSVVSDLVNSIDENVKLLDCKRLRSKATNSYINKVIVSFTSVVTRDKIINKSKLFLKGKGIFINPDLTKIQMELDYKLRQEKKRLFSNLSEEDRTKFSLYIKGRTIFKYDKINKTHSEYKEI